MPIDPRMVKWDEEPSKAAGPKIDPRMVKWQPVEEKPVDPTEGMSTTQKVLAGVGSGMNDIYQGASGLVRRLGPQYAASADFLGLPGKADIEESRRIDAPLSNTIPGFLGKMAGNALPGVLLAPALGSSVAGAGAAGIVTGAMQPAASDKEFLLNTATGGLGGVAGQGVANRIGDAVANRALKTATQQSLQAPKLQIAQDAVKAGFVIPPADLNPGMATEVLSGLSGKLKTAQTASQRNQLVTNQKIAAEFGLPADVPLSLDALTQVRKQAGQAYDAVASSGVITPGPSYNQALDNIIKPYQQAMKGFPNSRPNPVMQDIESLRSGQFDAESAVSKISALRADADKAYASGDKAAGKSLKAGAEALEDAIDGHLVSINAPADLLSNFREARKTIAKTYSVQKALNLSTGDISAPKLATQFQNQKPLSGNIRDIAEIANAYPQAMQALKEAPKQFSPLDFAAMMMSRSGSRVADAATLLARPVARAGLLSAPYQQAALRQSTGGGGLLGTIDPLLDYAVPLGINGGLLANR